MIGLDIIKNLNKAYLEVMMNSYWSKYITKIENKKIVSLIPNYNNITFSKDLLIKYIDNLNKEIDKSKEYHWGELELALFWREHREDMAYGKVKEGVSSTFEEMLKNGYIVDLLSARPLDKYASLNKKLSNYFEENNNI